MSNALTQKSYQRFWVLHMKVVSKYGFDDIAGLISKFQGASDNEGDEAFYHLMDLFKPDLLKFCEIRCQKFGHGPNVAELIVERTFIAYARSGNFKLENATGKTDFDSFIIYLCQIARNILTDFYHEQKRKANGIFYDGSECIIKDFPDLPINSSLEAKAKHKVLASLSYAHRVIYMTYMSYEHQGVNLPRKLLKELREHLKVSQSTIRAYKKEALDKIRDALSMIELAKES